MFTLFGIAAADYFDVYRWVIGILIIQDIALIGYMLKDNK